MITWPIYSQISSDSCVGHWYFSERLNDAPRRYNFKDHQHAVFHCFRVCSRGVAVLNTNPSKAMALLSGCQQGSPFRLPSVGHSQIASALWRQHQNRRICFIEVWLIYDAGPFQFVFFCHSNSLIQIKHMDFRPTLLIRYFTVHTSVNWRFSLSTFGLVDKVILAPKSFCLSKRGTLGHREHPGS